MNRTIKFLLDGCDICFLAEAPADMTLEQLLKQADKIKPDWCACGIRSLKSAGFKETAQPEIVFGYDSVQKTNEDVPCRILENETELLS